MKIIKTGLLSALFAVGFSMSAMAGVVVIMNPGNSNMLDETEVRNIYLGKLRAFADGSEALPLDQEVGSAAREVFIRKVLRKDEGNLNAYWARMLFSSKGKPPRVAGSTDGVKKLVATNKSAIGYIDAADVDNSVKVIITIP